MHTLIRNTYIGIFALILVWLGISGLKEIGISTRLVLFNFSEPLQYSEYDVGDEYGWHRDVHDEPYSNGLVRKVSFSTILNDDFEGGEFDIETKNPEDKRRYETFKSEEYNTIIFPAHMWHRVRPVKSGVRKSIVGWLLGRP